MKSALIFLLIFPFCISISLAQVRVNTDSLERVLPKLNGIDRTDAWITLAGELMVGNPEKCGTYARLAIEWSEKNKYPKGIAFGSFYLANMFIYSGHMKEGAPYLGKALQYATEINDSVLMARAWNMKGTFLYEEHDFTTALRYYNKALEVFKNRHDSNRISSVLNNMALTYGGLDRNADEIRIHHEVLDIETRRGNLGNVAGTSNNLAAVHYRMEDYDQAKRYFLQGLENSRKAGQHMYEGAALHGLGNVEYRTGRYDAAIRYYEQAVKINSTYNYINSLGLNYLQMSGVYSDQGNWPLFSKYNEMAGAIFRENQMIDRYVATLMYKGDGLFEQKRYKEALASAKIFYHLSDSLQDLPYLINASKQLYENHKALGQFEQSTEWLEKYVAFNDSAGVLEKQELVKELEERYQLKNAESKNLQLEEENNVQQDQLGRQQLTIGAVAVIGVLILVIAILLFIGFKRLRSANAILEEKNKQIEQQAESLRELNATKDKFFSIIAHDLKNPFGGLMNLSSMMADDFENIPKEELKEMLDILRDSSKGGYALLENLLEWSRSQTGIIEMKTTILNLSELTRSELDKQQLAAHAKQIKLQMEVPADLKTQADENMFRLIIRNLVSNAIKFTPPGGNIEVRGLSKHGLVEISVNDTGVGMDEATRKKLFRQDTKFSTHGTANEKGTGLGLLLCKEFVEKQQGKIWVESEPGKGSSFRFSLPML